MDSPRKSKTKHPIIQKTHPDEDSDSDGIHSMDDGENGGKIFNRSRYESQNDQEEIDNDAPDRQLGETKVLEPYIDQQMKILQVTGQGQGSHNNLSNQTEIPPETQKKQKKASNDRKQRNFENKQANLKSTRHYKYFNIKFNSRLVFSAFYLLKKEINSKIDRSDGFVRMNPFLNPAQITICYFQQSKRDQISLLVENALDTIHFIEMFKKDAECGIQLSFKYMQYLLQSNMAIFKDHNQNHSPSYFICGIVHSKKLLMDKIQEMRKSKFVWMNFFRYENTRSYRAILRKIFNTKQMHEMINQKMKAQQIEVAYLRQGFPMPVNSIKKRGVMVLITSTDPKNLSIHQETEQIIGNFIKQTFAVFCFSFKRRKQTLVYRYTPKVENVTWFFIHEFYSSKTTYLYILINKSQFEKMRNTIIDEIQGMNLNISGRRFFKGLQPSIKDNIFEEKKFQINPYPKVYAYSWKIKAKQGDVFDWKAQLAL